MSLDQSLRQLRKQSSEYNTVVIKVNSTELETLRAVIYEPLKKAAELEVDKERKPSTKCLESIDRFDRNEMNSWLVEAVINRFINQYVMEQVNKRRSNIAIRCFYKVKWSLFRFYQRLRRISPKVRAEDKRFEEFLFGKKNES